MEELDDARIAVLQTAYHELEHLTHWGDDVADPRNPKELAQYLYGPGEMRAHAKQYAYLYREYFEGEAFHIENMRKIIALNREGADHTIPPRKRFKAEIYFDEGADPALQKARAEIPGIKETQKTFMMLVEKFVRELNVIRIHGAKALAVKRETAL